MMRRYQQQQQPNSNMQNAFQGNIQAQSSGAHQNQTNHLFPQNYPQQFFPSSHLAPQFNVQRDMTYNPAATTSTSNSTSIGNINFYSDNDRIQSRNFIPENLHHILQQQSIQNQQSSNHNVNQQQLASHSTNDTSSLGIDTRQQQNPQFSGIGSTNILQVNDNQPSSGNSMDHSNSQTSSSTSAQLLQQQLKQQLARTTLTEDDLAELFELVMSNEQLVNKLKALRAEEQDLSLMICLMTRSFELCQKNSLYTPITGSNNMRHHLKQSNLMVLARELYQMLPPIVQERFSNKNTNFLKLSSEYTSLTEYTKKFSFQDTNVMDRDKQNDMNATSEQSIQNLTKKRPSQMIPASTFGLIGMNDSNGITDKSNGNNQYGMSGFLDKSNNNLSNNNGMIKSSFTSNFPSSSKFYDKQANFDKRSTQQFQVKALKENFQSFGNLQPQLQQRKTMFQGFGFGNGDSAQQQQQQQQQQQYSGVQTRGRSKNRFKASNTGMIPASNTTQVPQQDFAMTSMNQQQNSFGGQSNLNHGAHVQNGQNLHDMQFVKVSSEQVMNQHDMIIDTNTNHNQQQEEHDVEAGISMVEYYTNTHQSSNPSDQVHTQFF
eukprot:403341973